jgi:hypothetical protein
MLQVMKYYPNYYNNNFLMYDSLNNCIYFCEISFFGANSAATSYILLDETRNKSSSEL